MKRKHQIVVPILLVLLLCSIALNYLLYSYGRMYYHQLNSTRLDPLGLAYFDEGGSQKNEQNEIKRVVFYGDSRAASWPNPNIKNYEFINRGIGAQTSAQVLQRFDYHVKILGPDVVIIQVGVNDLKTIPLFPEQEETIIQNLKFNISEIVQKSNAEGAIVILTTIFPTAKVPIERRLFWSDDVALAIIDANQFISSMASENVIIFDSYSILVGKGEKIQLGYSYDFLHVNAQGYEALNTKLIEVMINLDEK